MIALVVSKMEDGDFKVKEAYYDRGGLKRMTQLETEPVDWASTVREVQESIEESSYKTYQYLNVASAEDLHKIFGMSTSDFVSEYQNKFLNM